MKSTGTVLCTSSHVIDLADGRSLAPGEVAEDIDTGDPHVRDLVLSGQLYVQKGSTPKERASFEDTVKARTPQPDEPETEAAPAAPKED